MSAMTYIYSLPPKTPKNRLQLLRKAFTDTMKDPDFLAETKKANLDLDPQSGEQLEKIVKGFFATDPAFVKRLAKILQ